MCSPLARRALSLLYEVMYGHSLPLLHFCTSATILALRLAECHADIVSPQKKCLAESFLSLMLPFYLQPPLPARPACARAPWRMSATGTANGHREPPSVVSNAAHPDCNGHARAWVVQKFGGTSVGKFALNIAEDIVR
jgi:hypothetical protein